MSKMQLMQSTPLASCPTGGDYYQSELCFWKTQASYVQDAREELSVPQAISQGTDTAGRLWEPAHRTLSVRSPAATTWVVLLPMLVLHSAPSCT